MPPEPRALRRSLNVADLRRCAAARLPRPIFDYLDGAAEDERTARDNVGAFDRAALLPRAMVDVSAACTSVRLFGREAAFPLLLSPTGSSRFYHADGEAAVARAAAAAGIPYGLSVMSSLTLETVAAAAPGTKLFQLLFFRDRGLTWSLVDRAKAAGFHALCLTVDAAVRGKRERELRVGLGLPVRLAPAALARFAARPGWCWKQLRAGPLQLGNIAEWTGTRTLAAHSAFVSGQLDESATWTDVAALAARWGGPFAVKGIMRADDALRAVEAGASTIIVSNHGGRQLDGAAGALEALPAIADAVGGKADIILDGGVRRGVHILKALALGATACSVGRPYLYALAAGGEAGVRRLLTLLADEFKAAMQLAGCTDATAIDRNLILELPARKDRP